MFTRHRYFNNKILEIGKLSHALRSALSPYASDPQAVEFTISETLPDGTTSRQGEKSYTDLETICDISKQSISSRFQGEDNENIWVFMHGSDSFFSIEIICNAASVMNQLFDGMISGLDLDERISPENALDESLKSITSLPKEASSEIGSDSKTEDIEFEKITIAWLIKHVPVRIWLYLLGLVLGALYLGMKLGQLNTIKAYLSL